VSKILTAYARIKQGDSIEQSKLSENSIRLYKINTWQEEYDYCTSSIPATSGYLYITKIVKAWFSMPPEKYIFICRQPAPPCL